MPRRPQAQLRPGGSAGTGDSGDRSLWASRGESHEEPRVSRAARPRLPLAHGYTGRLVPERLASWPWRPYETRVARLLGCCEPTKIARGGGAPSRRRSPALPGSRGRGAAAGDTPLRAAPREARTLRRQKSCPPHAEPPQSGLLPAPGRPLALS